MGFQRVFHQFIRRRMTDGYEDTFCRDFSDLTGFYVLCLHAGYAQRVLVPQNLNHLMIPERHDLFVLHQTVNQDLFRAQRVTTVDQSHLRGKIRQEKSLFHSSVPAADHNDFLTAIEEPVTGRTGRHAKALEFLFRLKAQPFRTCTCCQDHSISGVNRATVALRGEGAFGHIKAGDQIADDLTAHGAGVFFHLHHQFRALNVDEGRVVLNLSRGGQLTAGLHTLHEQRVQHSAACVNPRSIARRAGTDDKNFRMPRIRHGRLR